MKARILTIGALTLALLAAAEQSATPPSPEHAQAPPVTTLPEPGEPDLGFVEPTNGAPARFDFSAVTNAVVAPTFFPNSNITMQVTGTDGIKSRLATSKSSARSSSIFGFGGRVPLPNGISNVTFDSNKGFSCRVAGCRVGLHEIRLTFTNNVVRRTSLLFVGRTSLRTPLSVEVVEFSGGVLLIFAFLGVTGLLWHGLSTRHFEPDAPPSGSPPLSSANSERPPS